MFPIMRMFGPWSYADSILNQSAAFDMMAIEAEDVDLFVFGDTLQALRFNENLIVLGSLR